MIVNEAMLRTIGLRGFAVLYTSCCFAIVLVVYDCQTDRTNNMQQLLITQCLPRYCEVICCGHDLHMPRKQSKSKYSDKQLGRPSPTCEHIFRRSQPRDRKLFLVE